ncbi:N-acetylglucosaminyl-phosphatidylinositol de-N-acetylase [Onthophagus taurus]|uniref:N-acetylglucosaminyl-phosphatidylinositol de-N-acetylase n=1 Tax=Onthophagus taurus TaxID=166361 RepID=UPI000C20ED65|nr:N-acetylglucosaminyl-phosphatidylinositol de-N-acetylase [Onthophagus taurus]
MSKDFLWRSNCVQRLITFEFWSDLITQVRTYTEDAVEHLVLACFLYITFCVLLYALITRWDKIRFTREIDNSNRTLLVIAHPDDECMFFGPIVHHLIENDSCRLYVICLSMGNGYGLGKKRKQELYDACRILGVNEGDITIYNNTYMQDSIDGSWPTELVANLILQQVEMYNIDTLITFDKHGVSRHINHCSIYYAIAHLSLDKRLPPQCRVYVLESVNIVRKYWFLLDIPLSFLLSRYRYILRSDGRTKLRQAMKKHQSQLVWYRKLYMLFSRYIIINTLQQMDLSDIELDLVDD